MAGSDLVTILPDGTAHFVSKPLGLKVRRLPMNTPKLRFAMAWHPRTDKSPPCIWLRERIRVLYETWEKETPWDKDLL
ncbi:MAG: hypothetical protein HQL54_09660 [Magnetococcales bacterium]|nr:hypothetical protein [Magnetococcales bacterium]